MQRVSKDKDMEYHAKILLLGDPAVGKTSLLRKYVYNSFTSDYTVTLGVDFLTKSVTLGNITVNMAVWDVAGEAKFSSFKSMYYTGASGAFLVFDLTRRKTLDNLNFWYTDAVKYSPEAIIIIIGNKGDLQSQFGTDEVVASTARIPEKKYFTTSAKTGENVEEAFLYMTEKLLHAI